MDGAIQVSVPGLARLERLPGAIENGQRVFVDRLSKGIAEEIRRHIRSRSADGLAAHWKGHGVDATTGVVEASGPAYLGASVRGAFVRPVHAKVLRFVKDGEVLFRPWVRITPGDYIGRPDDRKNSYVTRALRNRRAIAEREFEATFGHLEGA
jgi:hypothetical protein